MDQRLRHVCASRPWHCTLPDIIPPPSSTLHCSHLCMQSLSITPIHSQLCISFTLAAQAHSSERNCSSSTLGSCCTTLIGTRWHTRKETYSASPILKVVCHQIMPPRPMVPYTLPVCMIWPCYPPEWAWSKCLPPLWPASTWRSLRQPYVTMPQPQQLQNFHHICCR